MFFFRITDSVNVDDSDCRKRTVLLFVYRLNFQSKDNLFSDRQERISIKCLRRHDESNSGVT